MKSELQTMKQLLDVAGFHYEECYMQPMFKGSMLGIVLVVQGYFYDELEIMFSEDGVLLNMRSHVAHSGPSCARAQKIYDSLE